MQVFSHINPMIEGEATKERVKLIKGCVVQLK